MSEGRKPYRVLFLCTGNACRSQIAEAMLRHMAGDRMEVRSAGSAPAGFVHPIAIEVLNRLGVPAEGLRSKSWDEFRNESFDLVVTLCDNAAATPCPVWPGSPLRVHWPLPDPSFHPGGPEDRLAFALTVARNLRGRLARLLELPLETMSPDEREAAIRAIDEG